MANLKGVVYHNTPSKCNHKTILMPINYAGKRIHGSLRSMEAVNFRQKEPSRISTNKTHR